MACGWKNLELVQLSWIGADFTIYSRAHILVSFSSILTWRRKWQPTPVLLPGNSPGGRAWYATVHGVAERPTGLSDFTFHALEKEMATHSSVLAWRIPGRGTWWTAVYGVVQSRTRLKRLSSSSSSSALICQ